MNIPKEHESTVLRALAINQFLYWIMWDMISDEYIPESKIIASAIDLLLEGVSSTKIKKIDNYKNVFSDEYNTQILEDIVEYEEYAFFDHLCTKLWEKYPEKWVDFFYKEIAENGLENFEYTGE